MRSLPLIRKRVEAKHEEEYSTTPQQVMITDEVDQEMKGERTLRTHIVWNNVHYPGANRSHPIRYSENLMEATEAAIGKANHISKSLSGGANPRD